MGSSKQKYLLTIHNEQNSQRNKLLERARPLRLVAPLSAQAKVKLSFGGKLALVFPCFYFGELMTLHRQCTSHLQRRIQDFPRGGRQLPRGGRQHTILPNFPENCMKSKEFGRPGGGGAWRAPPAPPSIRH